MTSTIELCVTVCRTDEDDKPLAHWSLGPDSRSQYDVTNEAQWELLRKGLLDVLDSAHVIEETTTYRWRFHEEIARRRECENLDDAERRMRICHEQVDTHKADAAELNVRLAGVEAERDHYRVGLARFRSQVAEVKQMADNKCERRQVGGCGYCDACQLSEALDAALRGESDGKEEHWDARSSESRSE